MGLFSFVLIIIAILLIAVITAILVRRKPKVNCDLFQNLKHMKNIWICGSIFILAGASMMAQSIIENPEKPLTKNAGRILELKELMRITDEGEEFFFKRPHSLKLDNDGYIYFIDNDFFLKFSPEGKFIKNLYRKGQGPGETMVVRYDIQDETINIWDRGNWKIVFYNLSGEFLREFKPEQYFRMSLIGSFKNSLIFYTYEIPSLENRKGMMDLSHQIILMSKESGEVRKIRSFSISWYLTSSSGSTYEPFFVEPNVDGSTLFINESPEYQIKVMDTETGEILRIFQRKYKRIKYPKQPRRPGLQRPKREYLYDIATLNWNEGQIWIRTSTQDEDKGILYDVFSPEGEYLDCFYIPHEVSFMNVYGDILFARNQNEEGNYAVVKYKILNGPKR